MRLGALRAAVRHASTRLPALAVAAAGLVLALGQVAGLLHRLQAETASSAGLQSLVFGWPDGELFLRAETVIAIWNEGPDVAFAERSIEQEMRSTFLAGVPGVAGLKCDLGPPGARPSFGRYVRIAPEVSPGLPAPLAWTLSEMSRDDLLRQRNRAIENEARRLRQLLAGDIGLSCPPEPAKSHARPFGGS